MERSILIKSYIIKELLSKLQSDKLGSIEALNATKSLAHSKEFIAESKWDTRGIEAGYLAGAQEKRIKELDIEIHSLNKVLKYLKESTELGIGSLVWTDSKNYFITPLTGGIDIETQVGIFKVISHKSPLFKKLIEDEIEVINIE